MPGSPRWVSARRRRIQLPLDRFEQIVHAAEMARTLRRLLAGQTAHRSDGLRGWPSCMDRVPLARRLDLSMAPTRACASIRRGQSSRYERPDRRGTCSRPGGRERAPRVRHQALPPDLAEIEVSVGDHAAAADIDLRSTGENAAHRHIAVHLGLADARELALATTIRRGGATRRASARARQTRLPTQALWRQAAALVHAPGRARRSRTARTRGLNTPRADRLAASSSRRLL